MKLTRRNDVSPAAIRAAPQLTLQRRLKAVTATAADARNHSPTTEVQVLGFQRDGQGPPPHRKVSNPAKHIAGDLRFQRAVERVHRLGPRVIAELLAEMGTDLHRVEQYAELDHLSPATLQSLGTDRWPVSVFGVTGP